MGPNEPTGYENEPDEIFLPLPAQLYCSLYHLEMSEVKDDCLYFHQLLTENRCRRVLELGCGTGRLSEYLQSQGHLVTGIDISYSMLQFPQNTGSVPTVQMDMCCLGFSPSFDAVVIPYNTLNLLPDKKSIQQCLAEIKLVLTGPRLLLLQLFTPNSVLIRQAHKRLFQFRLFDRPEGGKLIKETIRTYIPEQNMLLLEERYKIRTFAVNETNRNYSQTLRLTAFSLDQWLDLISCAGYKVVSLHGSYKRTPYDQEKDSTLLVLAKSD